MKTEKILREGYGHYFGFSGDGTYWASATAGLIHVWKNFDLVSSYEIPGFEKGNIVFRNDDFIEVGLFEINFKTQEKIYRESISEKFALQCEEGKSAHYSQYKILEIRNSVKDDLVLVSIGYQPSRRIDRHTTFNGPTNRLLLFSLSSSDLLRVVAENYDSVRYANLFLTRGEIIFTEDSDTCCVVGKNDTSRMKVAVSEFIPLHFSEADNSLTGAFKNNYIQIRSASDLNCVWQVPADFASVNQIDRYKDLIFAAVNDNSLQVWRAGTIDKSPEDQLLFSGGIEAVALNTQSSCLIALSYTENTIHVISQ